MPLETDGLNFLAIGVAALAYFVIGALWYTVLFVKAWIRAYDLSDADVEAMQKAQNPLVTFPAMLVCDVVSALVLAMLIATIGDAGIGEGIAMGALMWLGFGGACACITQLGALRSMTGFLIDTSYHLVGLVVMGAILAAW